MRSSANMTHCRSRTLARIVFFLQAIEPSDIQYVRAVNLGSV